MREHFQALVILLFLSIFMGFHQVEYSHSSSLSDDAIQSFSSENMSNQTLDADSDGFNDSVDPCPNSSYNHCIKAAFDDGEHSPNIARVLWCGYPLLLIFIWVVVASSDPRNERDVKFNNIRNVTKKMEQALESGDVERAMKHLLYGIQYTLRDSLDDLKVHHLLDDAQMGHREEGENRIALPEFCATACDVLIISSNQKIDHIEEERLKVHDGIMADLGDSISSLNMHRELLQLQISIQLQIGELDNLFKAPDKNLDEARQTLQRIEDTLQ